MSGATAILLIFLLAIKHYFVDYVLQISSLHLPKPPLTDPARILHSIQHGILTFVILTVVLGAVTPIIILASIFDMVSHHIIDLFNAAIVDPWLMQPKNKIYDNMTNAFDDTMHYFVYMLIVFICI